MFGLSYIDIPPYLIPDKSDWVVAKQSPVFALVQGGGRPSPHTENHIRSFSFYYFSNTFIVPLIFLSYHTGNEKY